MTISRPQIPTFAVGVVLGITPEKVGAQPPPSALETEPQP
jgi:hypothetical protein